MTSSMSWSPAGCAVMKPERGPIELLAPAGSFESMVAAVSAGADAVYMGGNRFGARAYADNPDDDGLLRALDYVHLRGRKLYLTVNTLLKEKELNEELIGFLAPVYEQGLDAVIVQDIGVIRLIRQVFPDLPVHASTQMAVGGPDGARLLLGLGVKRLVLPRELSLEEIRRVRETGMPVEVFAHGALCYCWSGQCLMSSFLGGRSGNRGRCAQPCRKIYEGGMLLNMKDLSALSQLPALREAGVDSLKIEGRMKSPVYTAGVVRTYRKYLDRIEAGEDARPQKEDTAFLASLFDRGGFTAGYFRQHNGAAMIQPEGKKIKIGLSDEEKARMTEEVLAPDPVPVSGELMLRPGLPMRLKISDATAQVRCEGETVQTAASRPLNEEQVRRQLGKTGESDFVFSGLRIDMSDDCFAPVSQLNELRREALAAFREEKLKAFRRLFRRGAEPDGAAVSEEPAISSGTTAASAGRRELNVLAGKTEQIPAILACPAVDGVYLPSELIPLTELAERAAAVRAAGKKCYLALPFVFRAEMERYFGSEESLALIRAAGLDGVLIRSLDELGFWLRHGLPGQRILDAGVYGWTRTARDGLRQLGGERLTLPLEVHEKDLPDGKDEDLELVVYGRAPLMISAQCVAKTRGACLKEAGRPALREAAFTVLTDRTGAEFPCESRCRFCMSVLWNSVPTYIGDLPHPAAALRIQLTDENASETAWLLKRLAGPLKEGGSPVLPEETPFTRGNYRRGVQ